ncbi:MAG TPA: ABC transporter ATP-binding protein [Microvirga sp.]|jgi:peptide/nickel transport system ATP-binding protein|nr:ABC transporter ATP-binding protein [Microvirga sp.]
MPDAPVLAIQNLTLALPRFADRLHAVRDLSLTVRAGETLCVVGESGSGKSMTAHAVMGLLPGSVAATAGAIRLAGRDILGLGEAAMGGVRGREIGMIFQEPMTSLNPVMRVADQIAETFATHGLLDPAARRARVLALLDEVGLPDPARIARAYPHELSGGQRQRVMIAIALALEPKLLIADEPTTALDVTTQAQILRLIAELRRKHGTAVLFITHDFGVVAEIADRVAVLQDGLLVEEGPVRDVLERPQHAYTRRLLAAVPSLDPPPPKDLAAAPPALRVEDLSKVYGGRGLFRRGRRVEAAAGVTFTIRRGETLGLVGESGSGKSTVGRCLLRLVEPDGGAIRIGELSILGLSQGAFRPHRRRIQMVFQDPFASLNPRRRVGALIAEGPVALGATPPAALARAAELLALVGLPPQAIDRYPHEFSGGQRQRIGIARALALEPEVLVADEPVSALDVSVQAQILDLIRDLQARLGLAILFITHDLRVAAQVCDRIAVMQRGRIVEEAATAHLFSAPDHPYTRQLLAAVPGRGGGSLSPPAGGGLG